MSENEEKALNNESQSEETNKAVNETPVVSEAAGVEVEEDKPIYREKKAKKEKSAEHASESAAAVSLEDFDWDAYEKDGFTQTAYEAHQKMYEETLSTVAVDEVVEGTVISMNSREVVINIGQKSEGVVSLNEFRYNPGLKVGDKVEVYVESQEDKKGQLVLSHKKARAYNSW
ncbi:MAG TPA: S1 RNA-binding domain-containing protein, partial [Bacteroidales bacterium]|nr:S1 RNA-binding domain-containing protein [Bacteroidales bacterium]